jgi:hypothetical protein
MLKDESMNEEQVRRTLLSSVKQNQAINSRTKRKPAEPGGSQLFCEPVALLHYDSWSISLPSLLGGAGGEA